MKSIATGLVFLSFCLFLISTYLEPIYPYLSWVRAFSEASLVGALADWFAVTALFRHPMGIPIPHTAIIPKNKDRFGETLGVFVQENFLSDIALKEKLEKMNLPYQVGTWLQIDEKNKKATSLVLHFSEDLLSAVESKELASFLIPYLEKIITNNEERIKKLIEKDLPWYVPGFLHDHVYKRFISRAKKEILSPLLDDPKINEFGSKIIRELRNVILDPDTEEKITAILYSAGDKLKNDLVLQQRCTKYLIQVSSFISKTFKNDITSLISDTIKSWDTKTVTDKIESQVGRDLQFIRINGTIVGGLIGLAIHAARIVFHL